MTPRHALLVLLAVATLGALMLAAASCGPSFQVVYEGDVRFEHCYAVDESPNLPMRQKADCWRDWVKNYTYGQTRDRVEYAASRHYALSVAPMNPTDEALMEAAPGGGVRRNVISAPMPSSVYAAPPNTMPEPEAKADAGARSEVKAVALPQVHPPGTECGAACVKEWDGCKDSCKLATCDACDVAHRKCMLVCFKPGAPAPRPAKKN